MTPGTPALWTTTQAARAWGVSRRQAGVYCAQGRVPGALRVGHAWLVPAGAPKPPGLPEGSKAHRRVKKP